MCCKHITLAAAISTSALFLAGTPAAGFEGFTPTSLGTSADSSDGRKAAAPSIRAHRLNGGGEIRVDGKLDDNAWRSIEPGQGFRVWDPDRGANPSEETIFKVAYDEGAVYFGVACLEHDPSKIVANLARRDRDSKSDLVSIYVDPYFDRTTGYNFRVNPLGVQLDSYIYNDGDRDDDWDAVWEAATSRDAEGWYAEIRIPFSAIRYKTGPSMTWGLQVYRYMQGRGEDTAWVIWDRNAHGMVSHFGMLTGIEGIRPPRQIELLPYVVQRSTDPSMDGPEDQIEGFQNVGADLKYGITGDLTLNATVQPDFGQVEADPGRAQPLPLRDLLRGEAPLLHRGEPLLPAPGFQSLLLEADRDRGPELSDSVRGQADRQDVGRRLGRGDGGLDRHHGRRSGPQPLQERLAALSLRGRAAGQGVFRGPKSVQRDADRGLQHGEPGFSLATRPPARPIRPGSTSTSTPRTASSTSRAPSSARSSIRRRRPPIPRSPAPLSTAPAGRSTSAAGAESCRAA